MRWIIPVILIGALLISFPVSAEFYKYYDEDGNVHFTDDFNRVPPEQREDVQGYEESISDDSLQEDSEEEYEQEDSAEAETEEAFEEESEIAAEEAYDLDTKAVELDERKAAIEQEYQSLVKEKERLSEMRKKVKTQTAARKYNEDVKALNQQLKEHDQKRQTLLTEIEQHNARLAEKNSRQQTQSESAEKKEQD